MNFLTPSNVCNLATCTLLQAVNIFCVIIVVLHILLVRFNVFDLTVESDCFKRDCVSVIVSIPNTQTNLNLALDVIH